MKKLTYTTPAIFLKITLAKSYLNAIITGRVSVNILVCFAISIHTYKFLKLEIQFFQNCNKSLIILAKNT